MQVAALSGHDQTRKLGMAASLALHAILVAALAASPAVRMFKRPTRDEGVAVDILTPQQFREAVSQRQWPFTSPPARTHAPAMRESAAIPKAAEPNAAPGMIVAKTMLSEKLLADPRSSQARRELATFDDGERVVQLCNLEAMDQIEAWRADFQPDRLVAYARSEVEMSGDTIVADGAAFRSRRNWYDIKFRCKVAPGHARVVAFEFRVGEPVPRKDWEKLNLPAVH